MKFNAFISHASQDGEVAQKLCLALERAKAKCWIAPRDIVPGMSWRESIAQAVRDSEALILLISSSSNESDQVKKEVALAGAKKRVIIPVRIQDVDPAEEFEYELAGRHWLELMGRTDADFDHAVNNILYALPKADISRAIESKPKMEEEPPRQPRPWLAALLRIFGITLAFLGMVGGLYIFENVHNPWLTLIPPGIGAGLGFWFFLRAWKYAPGDDQNSGVRIVCVGGMLDGKIYPATAILCAGRAMDNDIVVPESTVSQRHAVFEPQKSGLVVRDLRSTNGTYVNGRRIEPETKVWLENGDEVKLSKDCQVGFRVEIE